MHARHAPASFLHWGRLHLTTNEEERRAYDEVLKITNSTNYWECQNIDKCDMITRSVDVQNSRYIYDSKHVKDSEDITNSETVENSHQICDSSHIYNSANVVHSHNIKQGYNISYSDFVIEAKDTFQSSLITHSSVIFNSKNIEDSGFLVDCNDCHHCLLCFDKKEGAFSIFNHKINEIQWNFIYEEFQDMVAKRHLLLFDTWDPEMIEHGSHCHVAQNAQFSTFLDDAMINWIKHLPFYDASMAYRMTFHPSFLE